MVVPPLAVVAGRNPAPRRLRAGWPGPRTEARRAAAVLRVVPHDGRAPAPGERAQEPAMQGVPRRPRRAESAPVGARPDFEDPDHAARQGRPRPLPQLPCRRGEETLEHRHHERASRARDQGGQAARLFVVPPVEESPHHASAGGLRQLPQEGAHLRRARDGVPRQARFLPFLPQLPGPGGGGRADACAELPALSRPGESAEGGLSIRRVRQGGPDPADDDPRQPADLRRVSPAARQVARQALPRARTARCATRRSRREFHNTKMPDRFSCTTCHKPHGPRSSLVTACTHCHKDKIETGDAGVASTPAVRSATRRTASRRA